jgi:hypothetical protein
MRMDKQLLQIHRTGFRPALPCTEPSAGAPFPPALHAVIDGAAEDHRLRRSRKV